MQTRPTAQHILLLVISQLLLLVIPAQGHDNVPELHLSPVEQEWLASHETIRFGFADNLEPFAIAEPDGSVSGISADILNLLAQRLKTRITLELEPWPVILNKAKHRNIDAIAGIIPDHGKAFDLDTSIKLSFNATPTAFIRKHSKLNINKKEDLIDHKIVVLKEMFYIQPFLQPIKDNITLIEVNTNQEAFALLLNNKADIFLGLNIDHYALSKRFIVDIEPAMIFWDTTFYIAMGVRNDDPVLLSILAKAYASLTTDEILAIQRRWLDVPTAKPLLALTPQEQDFIKKHQLIQVGIDLNYAPFDFIDPQKGVQGISHELLKIIAIKTGLTFTSNPHWSIDALHKQVQTGGLDMLSTQIKSTRSDTLIYSDPFIRIPLVILARQGIDFVTGLDNIKNQRIGVVKRYFPEEYLESHYPDTPIIRYKSLQEGLFALSEGRCDFFLEAMPLTNHIIRTKGITGLNLVGKTKEEFDFCFAIRKDLPELQTIINKTLATIPLDQKLQIQQELTNLTITKQTNWRLLIQIAIIAFIIVIIMIIWNQRLQQEIKARKSAEESLQLAQLTLDQIPLHLFWYNEQFDVVQANKAAIKATGFSLEELHKKKVWDLNPSFNKNKSAKAWNEVKASHSIYYRGELKLHDGSVIPTEESLTYLQPENGHPYVVSIGSDITIRKTHEQQLKASEQKLKNALIKANESSRLKSEFLSNMSHEIRTPLNAIIGYSEMLGQEELPQNQQHYIQTIISSGKTLIALIDDILDLSKLEAGKVQIVPVAINPKVFFTHTISIFKAKLAEKELHHRLHLDPNLPETLLVDEVRLRQILFNIIGNAIKFTNRGSVDVAVNFNQTMQGFGTLTINVADTGIGIAKEDQQLIFASFQQKSGGISREFDGTGLGLTISKRFMELMNGQILLDSTVGEGSCFTLILPNISISETPADPAPMVPADLTGLAESTILITDDIKTNRDLIKACLEHTPLTILTASNGKEAVEIAKTRKLDLIFMDIKMDIMDGIEATTILRKNPATKAIPIIALSGADPDQNVRDLFDDFLQKPFSLKQIRYKVQQILPFAETKRLAQKTTPPQQQKLPLTTIENKILLEKIHTAKSTGTLTDYQAIADLLEQFGHEHDHGPLLAMGSILADNTRRGAIIQVEEEIHKLEKQIQELA